MTALAARGNTPRAGELTVVVAACLCWVYLIVDALAPATPQLVAQQGPGMAVLATLKAFAPMTSVAALVNASICSPIGVQWSTIDFGNTLAMWLAMMVAMLLPAARRIPPMCFSASLLWLAGYMLAWLPYCVAASAVQWLLWQQGYLDVHMVSTSAGLNIIILLAAAALYLLLRRLRATDVALASDSTDASTYGAGLKHGVSTMRCGAPLMLLLFPLGVMNVVAMAGLSAVMCCEPRIRDGLWRRHQPAVDH